VDTERITVKFSVTGIEVLQVCADRQTDRCSEEGKKRKVSKVRLQKFLTGQVGSSVKVVDVGFYCGSYNTVSLTHCVVTWTRKLA